MVDFPPIDLVVDKREDLLDVLLSFVLTDTLLFLPEGPVISSQDRKELRSSLALVNKRLHSFYVATTGLDVLPINKFQESRLKAYLQGVSDEKFAFIYLAAVEVRSVLLAILFVEGLLDTDKIFRLAFFEELCQQEKWGKDDRTICRHNEILARLKKLECAKNERSIH